MLKKKIGRNDECPCGSQKKYKKCCGAHQRQDKSNRKLPDLSLVKQKIKEHEASEKQRIEQQGHGHRIVSCEMNGYRIVAVKDKLYWSTEWKSFHDFLCHYIKVVLRGDWANTELKKPIAERHPILMWYHYLCELQQKTIKVPGQIAEGVMTGAVSAYLGLAYNLYLIAHNNEEIHEDLIHRLKQKESFHGAYYETHVAATFIKAGFDLEFENERDGSTTHCEFTATSKKTGNRYSIEAKTRAVQGILGKEEGASTKEPRVKRQLIKALKKKADHPRIVFIDINVPNEDLGAEHLIKALNILREAEGNLKIEGEPAPPAYIALTNFPYDYYKDKSGFRCDALVDSFGIRDFKHDLKGTLREVIDARKKHQDMHQLLKSMKEHYEIPSTFDGEFPEFALKGMGQPRLIIGKKYMAPDEEGRKKVPADLVDACVLEHQKKIYGIYKTNEGKQLICINDMTTEEVKAYQRHPTTFFGVIKPQQKTIDLMGFYDFMHDTYKHSSKEQLLKFMNGHSDFDQLHKMNQKELASLYSERMAISAWTQSKKK